jgi:hypothetical protein
MTIFFSNILRFEPRNIYAVASRFVDYAFLNHLIVNTHSNFGC